MRFISGKIHPMLSTLGVIYVNLDSCLEMIEGWIEWVMTFYILHRSHVAGSAKKSTQRTNSRRPNYAMFLDRLAAYG